MSVTNDSSASASELSRVSVMSRLLRNTKDDLKQYIVKTAPRSEDDGMMQASGRARACQGMRGGGSLVGFECFWCPPRAKALRCLRFKHGVESWPGHLAVS